MLGQFDKPKPFYNNLGILTRKYFIFREHNDQYICTAHAFVEKVGYFALLVADIKRALIG